MRYAVYFWILLAVVFLGCDQGVYAQRYTEIPASPDFVAAYDIAHELSDCVGGSRVVATASTFSMYPLLDWDTLVVVAPVRIEDVRIGDIVMFRDLDSRGGRMILHRVRRILIKGGRLITRGDHLDRDDPHPVTSERLVGRAMFLIYFDRSNDVRPVLHAYPTPRRNARTVSLCGQ